MLALQRRVRWTQVPCMQVLASGEENDERQDPGTDNVTTSTGRSWKMIGRLSSAALLLPIKCGSVALGLGSHVGLYRLIWFALATSRAYAWYSRTSPTRNHRDGADAGSRDSQYGCLCCVIQRLEQWLPLLSPATQDTRFVCRFP